MLRFRPAPARAHVPVQRSTAALQRRLAPRTSFSQQTPASKPSPAPVPPTVSLSARSKGAEAPQAKAPAAGPADKAAAAASSAKTPQEQLKEFEAVMMQYLQSTTRPLNEKEEKDGKKKAASEDDGEALLDAATEALIRRKEEEFRKVNFWDAFMAPELRHNFIFILLLALIIGLCLKILRLKGEGLEAERAFAAERLEMQEQALRAALPSGVEDQEAQADEVLARVQVITGLSDPKDLRLLRQQVLSAIRFTRATPAARDTVTVVSAPASSQTQ